MAAIWGGEGAEVAPTCPIHYHKTDGIILVAKDGDPEVPVSPSESECQRVVYKAACILGEGTRNWNHGGQLSKRLPTQLSIGNRRYVTLCIIE